MGIIKDFSNIEPNTKIIWDTGFGYEIGYFIREADDIMNNCVIVNLLTGCETGECLRVKDFIRLYSTDELQYMYASYGYYNEFTLEQKNCNLVAQ